MISPEKQEAPATDFRIGRRFLLFLANYSPTYGSKAMKRARLTAKLTAR